MPNDVEPIETGFEHIQAQLEEGIRKIDTVHDHNMKVIKICFIGSLVAIGVSFVLSMLDVISAMTNGIVVLLVLLAQNIIPMFWKKKYPSELKQRDSQ